MASELPKGAIVKIHAAVDKLLDRAKARVLGNPKSDKRILVGVKPKVTLPQLYAAAASAERALADKSHLHSLLSIAESYIESQRAIIKAKVEANVRAFLAEADAGGVKTDAETVLGGQLADVWKKATSDMTKIVASESNAVKNVGVMEGIVKVNAASGIEDPVIYFVVVHDNDLCEECKRLHLLEDEVTPRLWHMSEIKQGYHKAGEDQPSLLGEHPHCRCTPVTLMPGYGFVGGHAEFIELGHDEFAKQRGLEKAEIRLELLNFEPLAKSMRHGIKTYEKLRPIYDQNAAKYEARGIKHIEDPEDYWRVRNAPITVNFPARAIEGLKHEGRFLNTYETGNSMGDEDVDNRLGYETNLSIPNSLGEVSPGMRPIYGSLAWRPEHRHKGGASSYGHAWAELKPEVQERSTFTHNDSSAIDPGEVLPHTHKHFAVDQHLKNAYQPYVEAQVHGGVYLDKDVEALHHKFYTDREEGRSRAAGGTKDATKMLEMAKEYGLPLYYHDEFERPHLVYDPRSPEQVTAHARMKDKILADIEAVQERAGDEGRQIEGGDMDAPGASERWANTQDLIEHGNHAYSLMANHYYHRPHGHQEFVKHARELYPDAFPYLDERGEPKPAEAIPAPAAPPPQPEPTPATAPESAGADAGSGASGSPTPKTSRRKARTPRASAAR